jgi:hypothetical protein
MTTSTIIWIIVAVIVVIAIIGLVMSRSRGRRVEVQRAKAAEIRQEAAEHDQHLREREASATEAQAQSELARAEAQRRQVEAERLEAQARERSVDAESVRRERDERMRLADLHDPDVRTDKEGYRLDEHGNRLNDAHDGEGPMAERDVATNDPGVTRDSRPTRDAADTEGVGYADRSEGTGDPAFTDRNDGARSTDRTDDVDRTDDLDRTDDTDRTDRTGGADGAGYTEGARNRTDGATRDV